MRERNFSTRVCVLSRDVSPDALVPAAELPPCVVTADNGALCIPSTRSRAIAPSSIPGHIIGLFRSRGFLRARNIPDGHLVDRHRGKTHCQCVIRTKQVLSLSLGVKNPT